MAKKIFITGTGTDVGKTYVSGLILKKLNEAGVNAAYYKAAMSGNIRDEKGKLIPGDAAFVKNISGMNQTLESMCPYIYEVAVSPHLASKIEGGSVDMDIVKKGFEQLIDTYDYVTMEGSGGIICPIRFDDTKLMLEDFIKSFGFACILVADAGLGTINSVVLTYEYMKNHGMSIEGIIFNNYIKDDVMHEDNIKMCQEFTGLKVLAKVAKGDTDLDIDMNELLAVYK